LGARVHDRYVCEGQDGEYPLSLGTDQLPATLCTDQ